jgi:hypothetical protein
MKMDTLISGMEFQKTFQESIGKVNDLVKTHVKIKSALHKYDGRTLVLNILDDSVYVFKISKNGIILEISPNSHPNDMYLEMDKKRAEKLINHRQISGLDIMLGKIKYRNISLKDVNFFKEILQSYR